MDVIRELEYVGNADGYKVWFNGDLHFAIINGRNIVVNWDRIPDKRKTYSRQTNNIRRGD